MKTQSLTFRSGLSFMLVICMGINPLYVSSAHADKGDDYRRVCDPINKQQSANSASSMGGDQAKGECAKAKMSLTARRVEGAKAAIFGAAATAAYILYAIENGTGPYGKACRIACMAMGIAIPIGTGFMDKQGVTQNKEVVGGFAASASQVMTAAGTAYSAYTMLASTMASSAATAEASSSSSSNNNGCLVTGIMMTAQFVVSGAGVVGATKILDKTLDSAKKVSNSAQNSTTQFALNMGNTQNQPTPNIKPTSGSSSGDIESCESKNGNDYLKCLGQIDPELAAISNNPEFVSILEKGLGGKSLGDYAKGFNGDTQQDAANYAAKAMGIDSGKLGNVMSLAEKAAKDLGAFDKYEALKYSRNVGSTSSHDATPDFGKLMEGVLKQLNPDLDAKRDDAAEMVFRQLDLLPPEKIEQNKDISLFARIGYRYRKNINNLEQLNWSKAENQATTRK